MRIIVTRPEPDAGLLCRRLRALGHQAVAEPLLTIEARRNVTLPDETPRAVLVTSANAVRAAVATGIAPGLRGVAVFTVGAGSARAARDAGFTSVQSADGDLQKLTTLVCATLRPGEGRLLYLSGATVSGDLGGLLEARGYRVERMVLYDALPATALSAPLRRQIAHGDIDAVLLYSPRTARIWRALVGRGELARQALPLRHVCLSRAVREALLQGAAPFSPRVETAPTPDEAALLDLLGARPA